LMSTYVFVTVHGFRVQRFRVYLKPSCHDLARPLKYYGRQALTVDSWVMKAERMKTERLADIAVAQGITHKVYERKLTLNPEPLNASIPFSFFRRSLSEPRWSPSDE
jgi:hypothetical protein